MKKALSLFLLAVLMMLSSCSTLMKTAKTADASSDIKSVTVADLTVSEQRVTATIDHVSKDLRRGGENNVKRAVEAKALEMGGNADVLLDPLYVVSKKRGLFGSKISSISVSGRPAFYKNFRTLNDSVWNNPAFRGLAPIVIKKSASSYGKYGSLTPQMLGAKEKTPAFRKKGWHGYYDLYYGMGQDDGSIYHSINSSFMMTASFGYQFGPYFYLGLGTGYGSFSLKDVDDSYKIVPVFYNLRFNTSREANTWFIDLKFGTAVPTGDIVKDLENTSAPLFVSPTIGYSWGNLDLGVYALHHEYSGERSGSYWSPWWGFNWYTNKIDWNISTYGIRLGLRF
ncbi:MAG: hypothetical protein IJV34_00375 [Prevotella sp.]|nr:hypothetical protein [Prevotella sp.]